MRPTLWLAPAALAAALAAGCNLAGDITPPPGLPAAGPSGAATAAPAVTLAVPSGAPDFESGAAIFADRCAPCHGPQGLGDGPEAANLPNPPSALGDPEFARTAVPADWYRVVSLGRIDRFMPPFESLSPEQRWDVVAYALSLAASPSQMAAGEALYTDLCAECHGPDGSGVGPVPDLAQSDSRSARSLQEMMELVAAGVGEGMPSFGGRLTDGEVESVSAFARRLAMAPGVEAAPAVAPAPGVVRGRVTNGTAGGEVPQSLEVTLHGFDGQVEAVTQSATVDADGAFAFDQVENTPGRLFVVTASHHGVIYGSEALHLQEGGGSPELSVVIYETTQEPSELRVNRLHLLFEFPAAGTTEVVELWLMSNLGDRTLATEGGQGVLEMPLPEGASRPIFEEGPLGGRYQEAPGGFVDTLPVRPGEDAGQLTFSYTLPYERGLDYARPIPFPVSAVVVLIPESGPVVSGEGVVDLGSRVVGGTALHQYEVGPLAAGARLDLTLTGRPPSRTGEAGSGLTPGLAIGGLALLLSLAAAGWMWFRRPGRPAEMPPAEVPPESPEDVIRSIARLDEEHEAGHISDADYARRRPALVRRAAGLLRDRGD